jgi:hypothetical protein
MNESRQEDVSTTQSSRRSFIAAGAGATAAAVLAARPARAAGDQGPVGSWFLTIEATDPPLGVFNGLMSFHAGGVVTEARRYYVPGTPFGSLLETSGHGAWKVVGNRRYEAFFRFLIQEAPPSEGGRPIGTDNVRLAFALNSTSDELRGTFASAIRDNADNVLFAVTGTAKGERIVV